MSNIKLQIFILIITVIILINAENVISFESNEKCDYELDLFNCVNVNCNGKRNIKQVPNKLDELINFTLSSNHFLCSLDLAETGIKELSNNTLKNFYTFFNNLIQINSNQTHTTLKLSFSNINIIEELRFPAINIVLFIRDSNVISIQPKCLSKNPKLELTFVNFTTSSINWFYLLESAKLKLLNLRNIENLKEEFRRTSSDFLLYPISSIIDIKIYNSYLPVLDDYFFLFKLLRYVEQLEIISCSISFIKNSIFDKYSNTFRYLKHLTLSSNNLNKINDQTFSGLNNLIFLDLDDNPIEYIHPNAFSHLKRLKILSINNYHNPNVRTIGPMSNPSWLLNVFRLNRDMHEISFKTSKFLRNNFCVLNTIVTALNTVNENSKLKYEQYQNQTRISYDSLNKPVHINRHLKLFTQEEIDFDFEENYFTNKNDKNSFCSAYFVCKYTINFTNINFNTWNLEYFKSCPQLLIIKNLDSICDLDKKISECKNFYGENKNKFFSNQSGNKTSLKDEIKYSVNKLFSNINSIILFIGLMTVLIVFALVCFLIYTCIKKKCCFTNKKNKMNVINVRNRNLETRTRTNWSPDAYSSDYYVVLLNRNQLKV